MIMESCKEHYILLDHSKFGDDSLSLIAPVEQLGCVITDWKAPQEIVAGLQEQGVRVIQGIPELA